MNEIGERLKEARESMGISIEEASEDLKIKTSQLIDIEEGKRDAFKDILYLKYFIRDYSKYLGLDYESIVEDFNEFVFDYTSKISIDDIKKNSEKNNKKVKKNSNRGIMYYMEYKSVVIKYNIISGSIKHSQLIYHKGDTVHKYVFDTPTRKGYNFDGWYLDPNYKTPVPEEFEINENTTVYAKWTN